MPLYMVSYDLRRETTPEDYDRLYTALKSYAGWCWPLESLCNRIGNSVNCTTF